MAAKAQRVIEVTCKGATTVPIESLEGFQGNLKTLEERRYEKLKTAILRFGFSFPMQLWKSRGKSYIIDGHQRLFVVKKLIAEGWKLNGGKRLPADWIQAKNKKEARAKVLLASSEYGTFDEESVYGFMHEPGMEIDIGDLRAYANLSSINMKDFEAGWFGEPTMPELGETSPFEQITFFFTKKQAAEIRKIVDAAVETLNDKKTEEENPNKKGRALYDICRWYGKHAEK